MPRLPAPDGAPSGGTGRPIRVAIPAGAPAERVDKALAAAVPALSRARIQALIREGLVSADGRTIGDASARVKPGQRFDILVPEPRPAVPEPQAMALVIPYEDEALLVVDKPAGLVVHPAAGNPDGTLVNALLAHGAGLSGIGGVARPGIVHRLDKETSGLMVIAKTDAAHAGLAAQFADRSLSRGYLAVTRGTPSPRRGEIAGAIGRSPTDRKRMAVLARGGKPALTRYRVLRPLGADAALVECELATGRTHQIRVHMASIGHPLIGDPVYGRGGRGRRRAAGPADDFPRQALHAARLRFVHPFSGRPMQFESPLPADIAELIARLEGASLESFESAILE